MNRRNFLVMLGLAAIGCQNKTPGSLPATPGKTASAEPLSATPTGKSEVLGTVLLRRFRSFNEPPELSTWRLKDDGTATQLGVVPLDTLVQNVGPVDKLASVKKDSRLLKVARVGIDGEFEIEDERELPEGFIPRYFLAESGVLIGSKLMKQGEPTALVALGADGSSSSTQVDFVGEIRDWGMDGDILGAGPLGGSYHKGPINVNLFRLKDGKLDKVLSFDLAPYVVTGYALGYSFWKEGSNLTVSVGLMNSPKYGDSILMFSRQGDTLKFEQQIPAGFRPPPFHFVNQTLAYAQDNSGDLSTFVKGEGGWALKDSKKLSAGDDYVTANADNSVLFTKNNPGDILAFRMSSEGKLSDQIAFPELRWEVPERNPKRMQHDIARVLS
jgi:hypothetical protein